MSVTSAELDAVEKQLGRRPRGVVEISYRTPDGAPAVIKTTPKLPDGTPFPTLFLSHRPAFNGGSFTVGSCTRDEVDGIPLGGR